MVAHDGGSGEGVAGGASLSGDFKLALVDKAAKCAPDRGRTALGGNMAPDIVPACARIRGDVVGDGLVERFHETIPRLQ